MSDHVSRLIFQDMFSAIADKFARKAKDVQDSSQKAASGMDAAGKSAESLRTKLGKMGQKSVGLNAVNADIATMQKKLEGLTNKPVTITAKTKVTKADIKAAKQETKELQKQLKDLTGQKYKMKVEVDGQEIHTLGDKVKSGLSTGLGGLGTLAKTGILAGVTAAAAGISAGTAAAITAGATRQEQTTSLTHFLGGDSEKAQSMIEWAAKNASATQFSSSEIISATSRAAQITSGDIEGSKKMVQLAEDMASLNPGKTVSDAIEALADANMGEMERLTFSLAA